MINIRRNRYIHIVIIFSILIIIYLFIIKNLKKRVIYVGSECKGSDGKRLIEYLIKLSYPRRKIIWENSDKSSFIVKSNFSHLEKEWNKDNKPYVYWSGESYNANDNKKYDDNSLTILSSALSYDDTNNQNVYSVPYASLYFNYKKPYREYTDFNQFKQRKLLGYCNSSNIIIRELLVDFIAEKADENQVYALGKSIGTSKKIIVKKIDGLHSTDNVIKEYSNYKFIIAMENKIVNGYITEKIINAFRSGSIPIYWGDPKIAKDIFNEKAFICVNDFNTLDDCANHVVNLSKNYDKMKEMLNEHVLKNNKIPDMFRIDDYKNPPPMYKEMSAKIKVIIDNNDKVS
jgi:hypothetical protein